MSTERARDSRQYWKDRFLLGIFAVSIAWSAWGLTRGWDLQPSGCYGFRQTQTALCKRGLSRLAGYPIGAVVFFGNARSESNLILETIDRFHLTPVPVYEDALCALYVSSPAAEPISLR